MSWLAQYLGPEGFAAMRLSIWVSLWATALSLPLALWVAHLLARKRFLGREVLNIVVHLPLVLPPVVTGYLLLVTFGRRAPLGQFLQESFGLILAFKWTGAALAAAIMGFPLMGRAIRLALENVDPKLEEAAATLGASRARIYLTVTLPLMWPGVIAGAVLAFAKAIGEFGATITFVSNIPGQTQTLPSAIYALLQIPGEEPLALRLGFVSTAIAVLALVASEILARRARPGDAS